MPVDRPGQGRRRRMGPVSVPGCQRLAGGTGCRRSSRMGSDPAAKFSELGNVARPCHVVQPDRPEDGMAVPGARRPALCRDLPDQHNAKRPPQKPVVSLCRQTGPRWHLFGRRGAPDSAAQPEHCREADRRQCRHRLPVRWAPHDHPIADATAPPSRVIGRMARNSVRAGRRAAGRGGFPGRRSPTCSSSACRSSEWSANSSSGYCWRRRWSVPSENLHLAPPLYFRSPAKAMPPLPTCLRR